MLERPCITTGSLWPTLSGSLSTYAPTCEKYGRPFQNGSLCMEPVHRPPLPEPLLRALCSVAISWGWRRWAAVTLLAFYALCRPSRLAEDSTQRGQCSARAITSSKVRARVRLRSFSESSASKFSLWGVSCVLPTKMGLFVESLPGWTRTSDCARLPPRWGGCCSSSPRRICLGSSVATSLETSRHAGALLAGGSGVVSAAFTLDEVPRTD